MDHLLVTGSNIAQFWIIWYYHLLFVSQFVKMKHWLQYFLNKHLKTIINICILVSRLKGDRGTFIQSSCSFWEHLRHVNDIADADITLLLDKPLWSRGELTIWPSATIRHFLASIPYNTCIPICALGTQFLACLEVQLEYSLCIYSREIK